MASDYDKQQWQAEQAARDAALEKQRDREARARERSARNAQRKLDRLRRTLVEQGEISEFEDEFSESVLERIDKFGSAFNDPQLGRPGDALSGAQKRVVAGMNRKVKELKKQAKQAARNPEGGDDSNDDPLTRPRRSSFKSKRSSFGRKSGYKPRVRQLDEDFEADGPDETAPTSTPEPTHPIQDERPPVGRPFLRVVGGTDG